MQELESTRNVKIKNTVIEIKNITDELHSSFFTAKEWMSKLEGQTKFIYQNTAHRDRESKNIENFKEYTSGLFSIDLIESQKQRIKGMWRSNTGTILARTSKTEGEKKMSPQMENFH